jgi:Phage Terminase
VEHRNTYGGFLSFCEAVGLDLEDFQRRIARGFFDERRELLVLLPKGNGKTTLLAALALHHLLAHPEPSIYCGAASVQQARILFESARDLSRKLPLPQRVVIRSLELRREDGGGVLRMVPADGPRTQGLTPTLAIVDELHAHRDGALYVSMRSAMVKRRDMKLVTISTADVGEDRPLSILRKRALGLPSVKRIGPLVECKGDTFSALLWEVGDGVGPDNLRAIASVNPASWITPELLREQRETLPEGPFLRLHANARVQKEGAWLPAGAFQKVVGEPDLNPGEAIWAALDVGGEESGTALLWANERLQFGCWIGYGDEAIFGARDCLLELREDFRLVELAADEWRAKQLMLELQREGVNVFPLPQTDVRMCPASASLRRQVVERGLCFPDDPQLARHAANAIQRHTRRGWRLDKPDRTSPIDAMVCAAMIVHRLEAKPEPVRLIGWV